MLKTLKLMISNLMIVSGLVLLAYPAVNEQVFRQGTKTYIRDYEKKYRMEKGEDQVPDDPLYEKILDYNREIYENGQEGFKDAWSYTQDPIGITTKDGKFGYITVKKAGIRLPLYIGATGENLSKGAAVLGFTSIPIGTVNTNSVIAGHRGYRGIPYFREIESIKTGDRVMVRNPWGRLYFRVTKIDIIEPDDTDKVKIQEGKDMVTLITCHPYRSHGRYRYVVYCEREGAAGQETEVRKEERTTVVFKPSAPDIIREDRLRLVAMAMAGFLLMKKAAAFLLRKKNRKDR